MIRKLDTLKLLIIILVLTFINITTVFAANYGIKVNSDGSLTLNGQNFKAMGVNVVDLVWRHGNNTDSDFATLNGKVPFIRVAFGGWNPDVYEWYYKNPNEYFAITDKIIKKAEENQIGIIIDFFWFHPTFFYYNREQLADMGNPSSKSVVNAKAFVTKIINRYKNSPAVWGYEIGNEYNLDVDLYRPQSPPHFTITKEGSGDIKKDFFTTNELVSFYTEIARAIKGADSSRFVTSGDAAARGAAYSLYNKTKDIYFSNHTSWSENFDATSLSKYKEMITKLNPSPIDMVSTHLYKGYFNSGGSLAGKSFSSYLNVYIDQAKALKKGLYLGEFGLECSVSANEIKNQINTVKSSTLQLSSIWLGDGSGRFLGTCGSLTTADLTGILTNDIKNYNSSYQSIFDNAWGSWKKTITVNAPNADYSLTKNNSYTSNEKNSSYYLEGDKVKITATAKSGYKISSITVKTPSGTSIAVSNNQFTVPSQNVIVNITTEKVEAPVQTDTIPPTLSIVNPTNGNWTNGNITLTLNFSDSGGSGINPSELYWSIDKKNWTRLTDNTSTSTYKSTWTAERNSIGYYKIYDKAGNQSNIASTPIKIDKTPPTIKYTIASGSYKTNQTVNVTVTDNIEVDYVEWKLYNDGVLKQTGNGKTNFSVSISGDGTWVLYTMARDKAGNYNGGSPKQGNYYYQTYLIDTKAPTIKVDTNPSKEGQATITIADTGGSGLAAGTYKIKYAWGSSAVSCSNMTSYINITAEAKSSTVSGIITITNKTGMGKIYICNESVIKDMVGNTIAASTISSDNMSFPNKDLLCSWEKWSNVVIKEAEESSIILNCTGKSEIITSQISPTLSNLKIGNLVSTVSSGSGSKKSYKITVKAISTKSGTLKITLPINSIKNSEGIYAIINDSPSLTVDNIAPKIKYSLVAGKYNGNQTINVTVTDNYKVDTVLWELYKNQTLYSKGTEKNSFSVKTNGEGEWTLYTKASDQAGNYNNDKPLNEKEYYYKTYTIVSAEETNPVENPKENEEDNKSSTLNKNFNEEFWLKAGITAAIVILGILILKKFLLMYK